MGRYSAALVLAVLCLRTRDAWGQDAGDGPTRAGVIAEGQAEKAGSAAAYVPSPGERLFQKFEDEGFPLVGAPRGFYPAFTSIYPGGRFSFGVGYRDLLGEKGSFDLRALYSIATYKRVEAAYRGTGFLRGRVDVDARGGWIDAPRIAFFGLGPDTAHEDGVAFRLRGPYADAGLTWKPVKALAFGGKASYEAFDEGSGTGRLPSIEERFTAETAPGLGEDPTYLHSTATASLLWLDTPGYSRSGGLARWSFDHYARVDADGAFGLHHLELVQHLPVLRETWVISLRARADAVAHLDADAPYFLLPSLGSGHTLRAFQTGRFRDRKSVLFTGEWRWIPNRLALDLALFADAGTVGQHWSDIADQDLTTDYGIGVRFHTPSVTAVRIDLAHGREGWHFVFTTSAPF